MLFSALYCPFFGRLAPPPPRGGSASRVSPYIYIHIYIYIYIYQPCQSQELTLSVAGVLVRLVLFMTKLIQEPLAFLHVDSLLSVLRREAPKGDRAPVFALICCTMQTFCHEEICGQGERKNDFAFGVIILVEQMCNRWRRGFIKHTGAEACAGAGSNITFVSAFSLLAGYTAEQEIQTTPIHR